MQTQIKTWIENWKGKQEPYKVEIGETFKHEKHKESKGMGNSII